MRDQNVAEIREETETADPYGDVALGVECAWPQALPAAQTAPSEVQP